MNIRFGLTPRENDTLNILEVWLSANKVGPSVREIMNILGLQSTSGVCRLLNALELKGWIKRVSGKQRAISLIDQTKPTCKQCGCDLERDA